MLTINGFIENYKSKAAAQRARDVEGAVLRRDLYGPSHSGKQRRKDIKVLGSEKPAPLSNSQGESLPPISASEVGDGFRSKQKKKALPKYNSSRPFGSR